MAPKKIALIANGISNDDPDALENILRNGEQEVDIFDVRAIRPTENGFAVEENGQLKSIDPTGYGAVARIIKGGVSGDTEKSWVLQKFFEDHGAKPHISIDAARNITDRILCKNVLASKRVATIPSITLGKDELKEQEFIKAEIGTLGEPTYIIRKSIGSGKDSLTMAASVDDAIVAIEKYRNPPGEHPVKSGVVIHKPSPKLDAETIHRYGLEGVTDPLDRTYQFRIIVVDGKTFGSNICYSEPGKFGLNPAQGSTFKAIPEESVPTEILSLAKKAADAHGLKIAAVDIAMDEESKPRVMDMNASPDLSFRNARGEQLKHAVATSIQNMVMDGPQLEDYRVRPPQTGYEGR